MTTTISFLTGTQAAAQAANDLQASLSGDTGGERVGIAVATLGAIGAITAGIAGTVNAAVGVTGLINKGVNGANALELELENLSSQSVVIATYTPSHCDVSKVPAPIPSGGSDVFLITKDESFTSETNLVLEVLIGPWSVTLTFAYQNIGNPGRWGVSYQIGENSSGLSANLALNGVIVQADAPTPSISVYASPIETTSGQITISIYDLGTIVPTEGADQDIRPRFTA